MVAPGGLAAEAGAAAHGRAKRKIPAQEMKTRFMVVLRCARILLTRGRNDGAGRAARWRTEPPDTVSPAVRSRIGRWEGVARRGPGGPRGRAGHGLPGKGGRCDPTWGPRGLHGVSRLERRTRGPGAVRIVEYLQLLSKE